VASLLNKRSISWIKFSVAGLLIAWWVSYIQPSRIIVVWQQVNVTYLFLAGGLGVLGLLLQWLKWYILIRYENPILNPLHALDSIFVGFALGMVSPGRLGELARGLFLPGDKKKWIALAAIDRGTSFGVTMAFGMVVSLWIAPTWLVMVGFAGLAVGALILWCLRGKTKYIWKTLPNKVWYQLIMWSTLFNLLFFCQFYFLLHAWIPPSAKVALAIPLVFAIKGALPISFMDMGIREGAAVWLLGPLGVVPAVAFNAAFTLFLINVLIPGSGGAMLLLKRLGGLDTQGINGIKKRLSVMAKYELKPVNN